MEMEHDPEQVMLLSQAQRGGFDSISSCKESSNFEKWKLEIHVCDLIGPESRGEYTVFLIPIICIFAWSFRIQS